MNTLRLPLLTALFILHPSSFILAQGSLTPPGAPAPTMKTLDQIEARIPISSLPFTITTSGSYYLTGSFTTNTGNGIIINADHVTLDLNGFTLASTANPFSGAAITINGARKNVTVRNGHIRSTTTFAAGVFTAGGFNDGITSTGAASSANLQVADVSVSGVADDAIDLASSGVPTYTVKRCTVSICGGRGIVAGTVRDCSVETAGSDGVLADLALHCHGESVGTSAAADGVQALSIAENCRGIAEAGVGVFGGQVSNSFGTSVSGTGLSATHASNCQGFSTSATGLSATTALNSVGRSSTGTGLVATGAATFCRGEQNAGTGLSAAIAIGCTAAGTVTTPPGGKFLGTP